MHFEEILVIFYFGEIRLIGSGFQKTFAIEPATSGVLCTGLCIGLGEKKEHHLTVKLENFI